jgi:pimeloyl-ACP methyl ester carboxylesterase
VAPIRVRHYGEEGNPDVVVLHGGPGAPGYMAPVARGLANRFHVLEPLQRLASEGDVTVAAHVRDLHEVVAGLDRRPAIVGSSWGAMLGLAYAAEHPGSSGPLVLVGCGTFDPESRAVFSAEVERRMRSMAHARGEPSLDQLLDAYSYDLVSRDQEIEEVDWDGNELAWADMLSLQADGTYPGAFATITGPVLMVHGDHDPHPGPMIRDGLRPYIPQLEYRELARCGHYPWMERHAREAFFSTVAAWLRVHAEPRIRTG